MAHNPLQNIDQLEASQWEVADKPMFGRARIRRLKDRVLISDADALLSRLLSREIEV